MDEEALRLGNEHDWYCRTCKRSVKGSLCGCRIGGRKNMKNSIIFDPERLRRIAQEPGNTVDYELRVRGALLGAAIGLEWMKAEQEEAYAEIETVKECMGGKCPSCNRHEVLFDFHAGTQCAFCIAMEDRGLCVKCKGYGGSWDHSQDPMVHVHCEQCKGTGASNPNEGDPCRICDMDGHYIGTEAHSELGLGEPKHLHKQMQARLNKYVTESSDLRRRNEVMLNIMREEGYGKCETCDGAGHQKVVRGLNCEDCEGVGWTK